MKSTKVIKIEAEYSEGSDILSALNSIRRQAEALAKPNVEIDPLDISKRILAALDDLIPLRKALNI